MRKSLTFDPKCFAAWCSCWILRATCPLSVGTLISVPSAASEKLMELQKRYHLPAVRIMDETITGPQHTNRPAPLPATSVTFAFELKPLTGIDASGNTNGQLRWRGTSLDPRQVPQGFYDRALTLTLGQGRTPQEPC